MKSHQRLYWLHDALFILIGAFVSGFALKSFLSPAGFLDGGVTGISLLLHEIYGWNTPLLLALLNIPLIFVGARQINRSFAFKTACGILALALFMAFFPYPKLDLNLVSEAGAGAGFLVKDKLLTAVFGGFFLGVGVGLGMRGGCALDGMEVLAVYTLRRSSLSMSEIILGLNCIIFLIAALQLGLAISLYAILTYFIVTRTIDYVVEGLEEYTGVTIISSQSEAIKAKLVMELGRGITVYKGERGFMKDNFEESHPTDIVFTVITRLEVRRLRNAVMSIDPRAFVFTNTIKETAGGVLKRHVQH